MGSNLPWLIRHICEQPCWYHVAQGNQGKSGPIEVYGTASVYVCTTDFYEA